MNVTTCFKQLSVGALLLAFTTFAHAQSPAPQPQQPIDWETALAEYTQLLQVQTDTSTWAVRTKPTPQQRRERNRWVATQHRYLAAGFEASLIAETLEAGEYDKVVPGILALMDKYPNHTAVHDTGLNVLLKMLNLPDVPEATRISAFEAAIPGLKDRSVFLEKAALALSKTGIKPLDKWALLSKAGKQVGDYPYTAIVVFAALREARASMGEARFALECKAFAGSYKDSVSTRNAQDMALDIAARAGDPQAIKELAERKEKYAQWNKALTEAFAQARKQLAAGNGQGAAQTLDQACAQVPAPLTEGAWLALLKSRVLVDTPTVQAYPVIKVLLERAPDGPAVEEGASMLRSLRAEQGLGLLQALAVGRHAYDRERAAQVTQHAIRATRDDDYTVKLALYKNAAQAARKLGSVDREVLYLIEFAEQSWDVSPEEAKTALRRAAAFYPDVTPSAEAGWLLALLEGKNNITQGAMPRARALADKAPVRPDLALPPAPAPAPSTTSTPKGITLISQNPRENFLAGQKPAVSSGDDTAAQALDKDPSDGWSPQTVPASMIVPLRVEATLDRVRVVTAGSTYYTVSLLDRQGKTLARFERDWAFWEYYRRSDYWPTPDTTLNILPTPGVCFVRLDIYDANDDAPRVVSLEAYGPAFPALGEHLSAPVPLKPGDTSVAVAWNAQEPAQTVNYAPTGEWMRGFPIMRWGKFWNKRPRLAANGGNVSLCFYGTNAAITVKDSGGITWQLDESAPALVSHQDKKPADYPLASKLAPGFHVVRLRNTALEAEGERLGAASAEFLGIKVDGVSRASVAIRFGTKSGAWGPWLALQNAEGQSSVAIPDQVSGQKPDKAQVGAFFDSREVKGLSTATVTDIKAQPDGKPALAGTPLTPIAIPGLADDSQVALDLLKRRMVVVVYSKLGTDAEYQAAKELADKAGVYLISDDMGLNHFPGLVLAVGTPHRNRYIRQFLAMSSLWNRPEFFASQDGFVLEAKDGLTKLRYLAATGDTPEAAVGAAKRLTSQLPARQASPAAPRLFASNTLDLIFPWHLRPEAPQAKEVAIRMASGERRSAQIGLAADFPQKKVSISATQLVSASGDTLPAPVIQPVANYEWEPFFGGVRLPNALVRNDTFEMPGNTARGVWITAQTQASAKPGLYRGTLTVNADGRASQLPVTVTVEPIKLAAQSRAAAYTFVYMPYWFHRGTLTYDNALISLAADEAAVGATHVGISNDFHWTCETPTHPAMVCIAGADSAPEGLKWSRYGEGVKTLAPGQALFASFDKPITIRDLHANVRGTPKTQAALAYFDAGQWHALPSQAVRVDKLPTAMLWQTQQTRPIQFIRITPAQGATISVERIGAYTDLTRTSPITFTFEPIDIQMDAFDREYAKLGLKPGFIVQTVKKLSVAGADLFDVGSPQATAIMTHFCTQLKAHLEKRGRADRTMIKVADEPADLAAWAQYAADVKKTGMKAMTCHSARFPEIDAAIGIMDPWVPHYQGDVLNPFFTKRREAGDKVWWYTYGPPNSRLTGAPAENLAFWWLTQKWNFDGGMHYAAMHPSETIFPTPFRYDAGQDHRILMAPDGSVIRTPRRQLEEEAITDMRVIEFVRDNAARIAAKDPARAKAITDKLHAAISSVVPYKYGYSTDPDAWLSARTTLYDLALQASKP